MKPWVFFVLCILAFTSSQDAVANHKALRRNSATNSPTRDQKTPPGQTTIPKSSEKGPTSYGTHRSHSVTASPSRSEKTQVPSPTRVPKSKSNGKVPIPTITASSLKTSVRPTKGTTSDSDHQPKSPISGGSDPPSTPSPKSSPPPTATTAKSTTTRKSAGTSALVSTSKTLTVSGGQTASAQVGWIVYGVGIGGSVAVGGGLLQIEGGTEVVIVEDSSGQDEVSTIDSDTSPTTTTTTTSTSTSKSTSSSTPSTSSSSTSSSSSSTSSSSASPTPYNIYPKRDTTPRQQSAFAQELAQVALPGSIRRVTGARDRVLLWVASLTPAQASELSRNPVVGFVI